MIPKAPNVDVVSENEDDELAISEGSESVHTIDIENSEISQAIWRKRQLSVSVIT